MFVEEGLNKNYVVLCHEEDSKIPISSVFSDAYRSGKAPAEFRIIDCDSILPGIGQSIVERFKFDNIENPIIFVSGVKINGEPQQIPVKHLKTGKMLVKLLINKFKPRAIPIQTTQDLHTKCLDKDICALLLKGTKNAPKYLKDAISKLLIEYPKVTFAAIDSSFFYAYNLELYLRELKNDQPRFVVFKRISGSLNETKSGRIITSIAPMNTNGVSYGLMSYLISSVIKNTETMIKIPTLPTIKIRTKKLVSDEHEKRQRKSNRQQQGSDDQKSGRERRRQERNVKPKTPEEIAEIERKRRIRMEEEAKKWNMAPEDMRPEDGDKNIMMDDEDDFDDIMNDNDNGGSNEDEEDVMDLD